MRFVVIGGGCYGSFYTRQLLRAADAGAVSDLEVIVVDHNERPPVAEQFGTDPRVRLVQREWDDFFDEYLTDAPGDDQVVPPPFTPHLALAWLLRALALEDNGVRWSIEPFRVLPGTPFRNHSENGTLTASHADWVCPVHCIEPDICPKTHGPRDWDMAETAYELAEQLDEHGQPIEQVHLLQCLHFTHGVGTYPAISLARAREHLAQLRPRPGKPLRALVGTVSRCHGALHLLKAEAGTDTVSPVRVTTPDAREQPPGQV